MKTGSPPQNLAWIIPGLLIVFASSACQPGVKTAATAPAAAASTRSAAPDPEPTLTSSPMPLPAQSPTPRIHVVKTGEDFGGIAYHYGITLKALIEANPKVNPNLMSVGTRLVIPASSSPAAPVQSQTALPTAVPVQLSQPACYATLDGGLDCFSLASNPLNIFVENVSVAFHLVNSDTGETISRPATTPLNLIPPGWALPLHALFPPPLPAHTQAGVDLQNALPYTASDQRYINIQINNRKDTIAAGGLSAVLEGDLILQGDAAEKAASAWLAATAYDRQNQVAGFRRWEAPGPLLGGQPVHFLIRVYSAGPPIDHLTLLAEARR